MFGHDVRRMKKNKDKEAAMGNPSIKETIYASVLKDILDGAYPQDAVINEKTLMEEFGVSKAPVREALVQLCSEVSLKIFPALATSLFPLPPVKLWRWWNTARLLNWGR